jgi:hypothetical protein
VKPYPALTTRTTTRVTTLKTGLCMKQIEPFR